MKKLYTSIVFLIISLCGMPQAFTTNGSAVKISNNEFQLTKSIQDQTGTVWNQRKINLNYDFTINTKVFLGDDDWGADGITFVLQPVSDTIIGISETGGNSLGYFGIKPSLAVEIDTWWNGELNDPEEDHLAFMKNGDIVHNSVNNPRNPYPLVNIEDGKWHDATFSWRKSTHTLTVNFLSDTFTYKADIVKGIFGGSPNVYWGFYQFNNKKKIGK